MMEYIASISYGKDSLAMLEVIKQNNLPLDRIVHVELMATRYIPADLPCVTEWKAYADKLILERYGIEVEHYQPDKTFEEMFLEVPQNRLRTWKQRKAGIDPYAGKIRGFPMVKGHWCSKALKINTLKKFFKANECVQYIGIASDEPLRHGQLNDRIISPLKDFNITEPDALRICRDIGLLAPTYLQSRRSGCWFCPFQPIDQLRLLRKQYPDLWNQLLEWDSVSSVPFKFKRKPLTVHDLDERFQAEDEQMEIV